MAQTVPLHYLQKEIIQIKEQIVTHYAPSKIILFGSYAKGTAIKKSDIDICKEL